MRTRAICGLLLALVVLLAGTVSSAQAAPAWSMDIFNTPYVLEGDTFIRGSEPPNTWLVQPNNSGDQPTTGGPVTLTVDLPDPSEIKIKGINGGGQWICPTAEEVSAGTPLSCNYFSGYLPLATGPTPPLLISLEVLPGTFDSVSISATITGGGTSGDGTATDTVPVIDLAPFHIANFDAVSTDASEFDLYTVAGGHPWQTLNRWKFSLYPNEQMKTSMVKLPHGYFANPAAAPRCPMSVIFGSPFAPPPCPTGSQVGTLSIAIFNQYNEGTFPLFNVNPDNGFPAQFVASVGGNPISLFGGALSRDDKYGLTIGASNAIRVGIKSFSATFWGVPSQHGSGNSGASLLTNPVDCSDAEPAWEVNADSWEDPGRGLPFTGFPDLTDPIWSVARVITPPVTGCDAPALASQFHPGIDVQPFGDGAGQADKPAGLNVDLNFPQSNDPTDLSTIFDPSLPQAPEPKHITVKFPPGISISPASADGLGACSDLASDPAGDQVRYDSTKPVACPASSVIGTASSNTPLLASRDPVNDKVTGPEPIPGDVYLIKPHPGDFSPNGDRDGAFRLLIQLDLPRYGANFKLPGIAVADKQTGQITATFRDNPQLPASTLDVALKSGPRAPLATPPTCGTFTTTTHMVPWSTPGTPDATPSSSFSVNSGPEGSACANSPAARPFTPTLSAGTDSAGAGQASPFVLRLARKDGEQELSSVDVTLPRGFTASLKGVSYCSDAAIAGAVGRSGVAEKNNPSCSAASRIGDLIVGSGAGASPFYAPGSTYLAGPYKGAPLSLAFITPVVAGPFDLGTSMVRAAIFVDTETAQIRIKTDPLPTILDGVPLRLRSLTTRIDRPGFSLNPTNCQLKSVDATLGGASGATATPSDAFQVGGCKQLGFAPKLSLKLRGSTKRLGHPALKATVTYPKGAYANIAAAAVALPKGEFLDQDHIGTVCTRVQFAAHACPAASVYGFAKATTPLLDGPVEGPVYLRSSSNKLPDLVADLNGQIEVALAGRVDTDKRGGIRNTFEAVPDVPVTEFTLELEGGKKGLLENSENLCKRPQRATAKFTGQNGKVHKIRPLVANDCKKSKKSKKKKRIRRSGR